MHAWKHAKDPQLFGPRWQVIDLCCGLGGISYAARELGCEILAGIDQSATAIASFRKNFPTATTITASVTAQSTIERCNSLVKGVSTRKSTLVVSGPPCQGFSVAGARAQRDPRNRVLMAVGNAIVRLNPDAALVENVAALLATRHRSYLGRFLRKLKGAGYKVVILKLDAADFGVPQVRQRMFCFAAKIEISEVTLAAALQMFHCDAPSVREAFAGLGRPRIYAGPRKHQTARIPNHVAMRHSQQVKDKIAQIPPGEGPMSYRKLHPNRPSRTLISGNRAPPAHYSQPRSITAREAARLQGFPDTLNIEGSFANQLLHVTNAVPLPLARAALSAFFCAMEKSDGLSS